VIIREATDADIRPLHDLAVKAWTQLAIPFDTNIDRLRRLQQQRFRIIVLYDGSEIVAALTAHPLETDRGPGYTVAMFVVDQERPDRMTLLDAIAMYACNIAMSEGRRIVVSEWSKATPGVRYGRDILAFQTQDMFDHVRQTGDAQAVIANILRRHPEWQLP
jgi:hypothetical protein